MSKLPNGWKEVELGEICSISMGQSPKSESYNEDNRGLPLIQGNADIKNRITLPRIYTSRPIKECKVGDIIMTVRAPVGAVAKSYHNACIGRGVCAIKSKEDNEFLYQFLVAYEDKWDKLSQGSTFTAINGNDIKKLKLFLPPLHEQKKIAEILNTVDQKIAFIDNQIKETELLKKGLMQKLLTEGIGHTEFKDSEIGRIPESWEVKKLGEIGSLEGGYAFKSKEYNNQGIGYQVIRMSNINIYGLNLIKDPKFLENIEEKAKKYTLKKEDILITLTGTIGKTDYGNVAFVNTDQPMVLNQRVGRYVPKAGNYNKFFYYIFNFSLFRNKFFEFGKGGTGNQANVGKNDFESISIPNVPFEEQKQIAEALSTADEKLETLKAKKESFEELKKGLMQKFLAGEVRV